MLPPLPRLADYGISAENGFLPAETPLSSLPHTYYNPWETIVSNLQALLLSRRLRDVVDHLPVLSTRYLTTESEWRRAYVVLAFILHSYVWGGDRPAEVIPRQITIPLLQVCQYLDLPPVATYAAVCLWNWKPIFADEPADHLGNLTCVNTFTGSLDEQWFYLISVAIEARGAPALSLALQAIAAARAGESTVVTACLQDLAELIDAVSLILQRMYEHCDPHIFYHRIRPYLAGSKNMADAGLPHGLVYDDGSGRREFRQYGGGSNAQSSLIQFFDIILGVEHRPTGVSGTDAASSIDGQTNGISAEGSTPTAAAPRHNFIHEMREYMPGPHRRFLEDIAAVANLREFVERRRTDKALCMSYDACLVMLRALRDKHIQMVSRYIIVPSRQARTRADSLTTPTTTTRAGMNLATAHYGDATRQQTGKKLRGTGGTALIPFLKQARDETSEPAINSWAKRLLSNGPPPESRAATASLSTLGEHADGHIEVVGLAGTWKMDDSEGGICHW